MAWAKNGSTTLSSAGDDITVSSLSSSKLNFTLAHQIASGNLDNIDVNLNNDSGSVYADRESTNGGVDSTQVSQTGWRMNHGNASWDYFNINYIVSVSGKEKLLIGFFMSNNGSGSGVAPNRNEHVAKYVPSPDADITSINYNNAGTGDYAIGSNVSVLGSELTPAPAKTIETGSIYIDTDINGRWWFDGTYWNMQPSFQDDFSTDKGWVSQDTTNIKYDGVNKYFYFNLTRDNSNNASHYDLGAGNVSNTAWVLRGKLRYTTFTTGFHNNFYIGLSDKPSTTTQAQTGDFIGLCFRAESASHLFIANDSDNDLLYTQDGTASVTWSNATDYYWEIKRTSATTYTVTVRTGSHSGTIHVTLNGTCASTTQDLRYIRFSDVPDGAGGSGTTGYVDDLEFYNGVTSVQE